jgi:hypothetical protein
LRLQLWRTWRLEDVSKAAFSLFKLRWIIKQALHGMSGNTTAIAQA